MITRKRFLEGGLASLLALQYSEFFERTRSDKAAGAMPGDMSVRDAIARRRTVRRFSDKALSRDRLMEVLWAAQGITDSSRVFRAVPSAGALYPLEICPFLGDRSVIGVKEGVYRYRPSGEDLLKLSDGDRRSDLARACLSQMWAAQAPVTLVISAVYERTMKKYGKRGVRYADIEAGCAAQNIFLMAQSFGLDAGIVGAFDDDRVRELAGGDVGARPLLVMPVGYRD